MQLRAFTEEEFDEVLRYTAPWKACGVDSIYSFPIKRCLLIKKAVYQLVKKMVEWKLTDRWDEENNLLQEGRTVLIYKGREERPRKLQAHHLPPNHHKDGDSPSTSGCRDGCSGALRRSLNVNREVFELRRDAKRPLSKTLPQT